MRLVTHLLRTKLRRIYTPFAFQIALGSIPVLSLNSNTCPEEKPTLEVQPECQRQEARPAGRGGKFCARIARVELLDSNRLATKADLCTQAHRAARGIYVVSATDIPTSENVDLLIAIEVIALNPPVQAVSKPGIRFAVNIESLA